MGFFSSDNGLFWPTRQHRIKGVLKTENNNKSRYKQSFVTLTLGDI